MALFGLIGGNKNKKGKVPVASVQQVPAGGTQQQAAPQQAVPPAQMPQQPLVQPVQQQPGAPAQPIQQSTQPMPAQQVPPAQTQQIPAQQAAPTQQPQQQAGVALPAKAKVDKSLQEKFIEGAPLTEDEAVKQFSIGTVTVQDLIAPAALEIDFSHMKMNDKFFRTLFVLTYPNILPTSWLSGVINLEHSLNLSTFYYPIDSALVMQKIKRKITEFQAAINTAMDEGKLPDPHFKVALEDAERLQDLLAKNEEKYFHYALYLTLQADSLKELNEVTVEVEATLGSLGIVAKPAALEMEQGFKSTLPTSMDGLYKTRNMTTNAISATFPFVTSNLTMDRGIMYGLNKHNNSLVIFDRFAMENANTVVFAKSGAGKSYLVKLEIYRSMMLGAKVIVIDPEREYQDLSDTVGGSYISFSQTGGDKINPFDLSGVFDEAENELGEKKLFLIALLKIMLGGLDPSEKAVLDRGLALAYQEKGITDDPKTQNKTAPMMEDLYKILKGMAEVEAHRLATRLEMYIKGSASGVFDRPTSVDLNNKFTVFSLQELSDELRPIAMFMMLDYIWTRVRKDRVKRILVVDEAWYMMQQEDSARFMYWFAKRARKYFLGLTTITQDVEDFLDSKYGKAIVTNSSIQVLMKQSTVAVDKLQKLFNLSEGEKLVLLNAMIGEGLFFAGRNHVRIQVVSSEHEHKIVSTDPRELARKQELIAKIAEAKKNRPSTAIDPVQQAAQGSDQQTIQQDARPTLPAGGPSLEQIQAEAEQNMQQQQQQQVEAQKIAQQQTSNGANMVQTGMTASSGMASAPSVDSGAGFVAAQGGLDIQPEAQYQPQPQNQTQPQNPVTGSIDLTDPSKS